MVLSQQQELHGLLTKGVRQARKLAQAVLVSQLTRVANIDPLSFYNVGETAYKGERMYWSSPNEEIILVGLGVAHVIQPQTEDRFTEVHNEWEDLLAQSITDPLPDIPAIGPVLIGGFSFDPQKSKTDLWREFPESMMTLPKFMLTVARGEVWLTTNCLLYPHDKADEMTDLKDEQEQLIKSSQNMPIQKNESSLDSYTMTDMHAQEWMRSVELMAQEVRDGLLEKVVLARELRLQLSQPCVPAQVMLQLRQEQKDSYLFAVESGGLCFVGASPEQLVKQEGQNIYSTCMAGSIKRGKSIAEDVSLEKQLLADQKNLGEHEIVSQMIRRALVKYCQDVQAPEHPIVYKARDIQHLYTPIKGKANMHTSLLSLVEQLSPTPATGGYPREIALERIRDVELLDRGWYAGPIGWMDHNSNGEFAVAIRSGLLNGNQVSLFAGCGIVADSCADHEYEETRMKLKPMLSALRGCAE